MNLCHIETAADLERWSISGSHLAAYFAELL